MANYGQQSRLLRPQQATRLATSSSGSSGGGTEHSPIYSQTQYPSHQKTRPLSWIPPQHSDEKEPSGVAGPPPHFRQRSLQADLPSSSNKMAKGPAKSGMRNSQSQTYSRIPPTASYSSELRRGILEAGEQDEKIPLRLGQSPSTVPTASALLRESSRKASEPRSRSMLEDVLDNNASSDLITVMVTPSNTNEPMKEVVRSRIFSSTSSTAVETNIPATTANHDSTKATPMTTDFYETFPTAPYRHMSHPVDRSVLGSCLLTLFFLFLVLVLLGPFLGLVLPLFCVSRIVRGCVERFCCFRHCFLTHHQLRWLQQVSTPYIIILTTEGETPLELGCLQELLRRRVIEMDDGYGRRLFPYFSQRIVTTSFGCRWYTDPDFRVENHVSPVLNSASSIENVISTLSN